MERFSHKEDVLLGYSPRKSFGLPKILSRNSDVDFHDVYGGPPRRSSIHDCRNNSGEAMNSYSSTREETISNPWSALTEKPVFGDESLNRRKYPSDDFFDDIFGGDESSSSTMRNPGRDPFSSTPASRILSPVRSMPPQPEPFGSSSLPPLLSLPAKLAKGLDSPAFTAPSHSPYKNKESASTGLGFPSSPSAFVSRVSTQVVQGQDSSRIDARSYHHQSSLPRESFLNREASSKATQCDKQDAEGHWKKDSSSSEGNNSSSQFHFSIYKWASKGVPLVMPVRGGDGSSSKERGKTKSIVGELPASVVESVEFPSLSNNMTAVNKPSQWGCKNQDYSSFLNTMKNDRIDSSKIVEELVPAKSESKTLLSLQCIITEVPSNLVSQSAGKEIKPGSGAPGAPLDIVLCGDTEKEITISTQEALKPELKPRSCLFNDDSDKQGNDKMVKQAGVKEGKMKSIDKSAGNVDDGKKVKKETGKGNILNLAKATSSSLQGLPINSEDKLVSNRVKGKVKEFIKIFNQETISKPKIYGKTRGQSTGVKDMGACKAEDQASVCATKADGKEKVDQILKQSEKPHFGINTTVHEIYDTSSERNDSTASCSESIRASFEAAVGNIEESHLEDLQRNCLVQELPHDQNKQPQSGQHHEEIQASNARIRKWSNGKEGNIRSLLSTLQYVLWPESGWKPVPLVDIIEGNSVKRAYQKALLCLHPDKLQQKGAAPHQKYIAEKVFDILQEAWAHFNSLGSF